jgi:hypothetical protein
VNEDVQGNDGQGAPFDHGWVPGLEHGRLVLPVRIGTRAERVRADGEEAKIDKKASVAVLNTRTCQLFRLSEI